MRSKRNSRHGFTVLEALLALALFAMAVTVITKGFVNTLTALDAMEKTTDRSPDIRFVRQQVLQISDIEEIELGGEVHTLEGVPAQWDVEIEETLVPDLFQVHLEINLEPLEREEPESYRETVYVLRPTWSDPVERTMLKADAEERLEEERRYYE